MPIVVGFLFGGAQLQLFSFETRNFCWPKFKKLEAANFQFEYYPKHEP
jgi:hypothetical protein